MDLDVEWAQLQREEHHEVVATLSNRLPLVLAACENGHRHYSEACVGSRCSCGAIIRDVRLP